MQRVKTQPHGNLRSPVWTGRMALGKFALTLVVNRDPACERSSGKITNRLAALRRERGLSREEFSGQLQIHPSTLIAMESGSYLPSLCLALRLSELLELPIEAIFFSSTTDYLA